jgi:hypothetical protein
VTDKAKLKPQTRHAQPVVPFSLYCPVELVEGWTEVAVEDNVSKNNVLVKALSLYLRERGKLEVEEG